MIKKRQTWHDKLASTYVVKLDNSNNLIPFSGEELITTGQKVLFGLAILLLPIGILAILLAITLIAINPSKQFSSANNTMRKSNVHEILNAVSQYKLEHDNQLPGGITSNENEISSQEANICSDLVPNYIQSLPVDPSVANEPITNCQSLYKTGYTISINNQGQIVVNAPKAELQSTISVTK